MHYHHYHQLIAVFVLFGGVLSLGDGTFLDGGHIDAPKRVKPPLVPVPQVARHRYRQMADNPGPVETMNPMKPMNPAKPEKPEKPAAANPDNRGNSQSPSRRPLGSPPTPPPSEPLEIDEEEDEEEDEEDDDYGYGYGYGYGYDYEVGDYFEDDDGEADDYELDYDYTFGSRPGRRPGLRPGSRQRHRPSREDSFFDRLRDLAGELVNGSVPARDYDRMEWELERENEIERELQRERFDEELDEYDEYYSGLGPKNEYDYLYGDDDDGDYYEGSDDESRRRDWSHRLRHRIGDRIDEGESELDRIRDYRPRAPLRRQRYQDEDEYYDDFFDEGYALKKRSNEVFEAGEISPNQVVPELVEREQDGSKIYEYHYDVAPDHDVTCICMEGSKCSCDRVKDARYLVSDLKINGTVEGAASEQSGGSRLACGLWRVVFVVLFNLLNA